jgi:ribosomal protein S18 acetylase RimI-like enzyme
MVYQPFYRSAKAVLVRGSLAAYNARMAAATEARAPEVWDLRRVRVRDLDPLLEQEAGEWLKRLEWDFRPSADLIRRFVAAEALSGYALVAGGTVIGYTYFVSEDRKGLVGDLYVAEEHRTAANEVWLLRATLEELLGAPYVERVESQLMMLSWQGRPPLPFPELLKAYPRAFMAIDAARIAGLEPGRAARKVLIENWSADRQEETARVIAQAYEKHVDGNVNDQYRSARGAYRFISNVVQYPGCGIFYQPASFVALDAWTGRTCGVSLTSMLSPRVGHITQICVQPQLKGKGLGYELLRRSLVALAEAGCRRASLTVTVANTEAVRLYERVGFDIAYTFSALVWERGEHNR